MKSIPRTTYFIAFTIHPCGLLYPSFNRSPCDGFDEEGKYVCSIICRLSWLDKKCYPVSNLPQHPSRLCAFVSDGFESDGDNVNRVILCLNLCIWYCLTVLLTREKYPYKPSKTMCNSHRYLIKWSTDVEFHFPNK